MQDGQSSKTAQFVSILRAHHFLTAPSPKILSDNYALTLCGLENAADVEKYIAGLVGVFSAIADNETAAIFLKRIVHSVCMRSALVEQALSNSEKSGIQQVILLGAGLDLSLIHI